MIELLDPNILHILKTVAWELSAYTSIIEDGILYTQCIYCKEKEMQIFFHIPPIYDSEAKYLLSLHTAHCLVTQTREILKEYGIPTAVCEITWKYATLYIEQATQKMYLCGSTNITKEYIQDLLNKEYEDNRYSKYYTEFWNPLIRIIDIFK